MTEMAMYRKKHSRTFQVNKYFRYDYIVWHLLQAAVRYTICAVMIAALFVVFESETFFYTLNDTSSLEVFRRYAGYYFLGLGIYIVISIFVYNTRYKNAKKEMLKYASMLKRLSKRFNYEDTDDFLG